MPTSWEKQQTEWHGQRLCYACAHEQHGSCSVIDATAAQTPTTSPCDCPKEECMTLRVDTRAEYLVAEGKAAAAEEGEYMRIAVETRKDRDLPGLPYWFLGLRAVPHGCYRRWSYWPKCVLDAMFKWWGRIPRSLEPLLEPYVKQLALRSALVEYLQDQKSPLPQTHCDAIRAWCSTAVELWHQFATGKESETAKQLRAALLAGPVLPKGTRLFQGRGSVHEPANEPLTAGTSLQSIGPWSTSWHPCAAMHFINRHTSKPLLAVIDIDHDAIPGVSTNCQDRLTSNPFECEMILPVGCTVVVDRVEEMLLSPQAHLPSRLSCYSYEDKYDRRMFRVAFVRVTAPPSP